MNIYKHILDSLNADTIFVDNDHVIRYMDPAYQTRFPKQVVEKLWNGSLLSCHQPATNEKLKSYHKQLQEGKEVILINKRQTENIYMKAVRDDEGNLLGYIEVFEKFTEASKATKENLYQNSAELYDDLVNETSNLEDIEFYKQLIPKEARVLEMGCGTGRVGIELAKRGNKVLGVDASREMLNVCHRKIVQDMEEIQGAMKTMEADFLNVEFEGEFDYILFPFRTFQVLLGDKFRSQCLENLKKHLAKDGTMIITMFDPDLSHFQGWKEKVVSERTFFSKDYGKQIVRKTIGEKHFEGPQIISYVDEYHISKEDGTELVIKEPMRLAYMNVEQATQLFEKCGFRVEHLFGGYDGSPVEFEKKRELIFLLKY